MAKMTPTAIRIVEVELLRAVAREQLGSVVAAENLKPGGGTVFLFLRGGAKVKVEITPVVAPV
jgi:hypothetical protein